MENTRIAEETPRGPVRWSSALLAGLAVGFIFLILVRGLPWFSSGLVAPGVMGRQIPGEEVAPGSDLGMAVLHLAVSLLYGLIIGPLVHRLNIKQAVAAGVGLGLGLYLLNLLVFNLVFPENDGQWELAPILTHMVFGMSAAAAYKGLAKRGVIAVEEA